MKIKRKCAVDKSLASVSPLLASIRVYSMVDSSRVSTFFISILLIVYGSFR